MTPERWEQVKEIFNSAIKYQLPEREVFLSQACSDDHILRHEVESLIESHEKSGSFIDGAAYEAAAELLVSDSGLQPEQMIGSYQILSFINRGGMGEVYLAQDLRLRRRVALKLLPTSQTRDLDRLRRFEQEARAASALNHPNIITIYEIAETNSNHFIATEFVEGETLRQRLSYTRLTLSESLHIAIQIADALASAHKAGIIHRDIKPENIMLRPDGYVKVLDFGLAKLSEQAPVSVAAEAPTQQVRTGSGIVIGTAGYMSPEQARGKEVDGRSDVFSLGALIYEMVAHRKPFEGETPTDIVAAILKTDPVPLSRHLPNAPSELVRIVMKSLRKDREERYQVVQDLLIDLRSLKQELDFQQKLGQSQAGVNGVETSPVMIAQSTAVIDPSKQSSQMRSSISNITESLSIEIKRHKLGVAFVLLIIALGLSGGTLGVYRYLKRDSAISHFWDVKLTRITNSGNAIDAIISPDGKYIVYALSERSSQSLWIRQVSAANDRQIVPPAPVGYFGLTFSRDGSEVYYAIKSNLDSGVLYRIPSLGGTPVKVLEKIDAPISFSPDGKRFVLVRGNFPDTGQSALVIANADGSNEQTLTVRNLPQRFAPLFFTGPSWSPDGELIAASVATVGGAGSIHTFRVQDGKEAVISKDEWPFVARVQWLPDMTGLLVIAGDTIGSSQVWVQSYPDGKRRRVTNDLSSYRALAITSDSSRFSTIEVNGLVNLWVVPQGDVAQASKLPTGNVGFFASGGNNVTWTRDGRLVFVSNESGNVDIWTMEANGENRKQLTANHGSNSNPVVSPDGRYLVFASTQAGAKNLWRMNIDGTNLLQLTRGLADSLPVFTPDGQTIIYGSLEGVRPTLWKVSINGGDASQIPGISGVSASISPDGKLMSYAYAESQDPYAPPNRLAIVELPDGKLVKTFPFQVSGTVPTLSQWSFDGKAILYTINTNNVSNIWSQSLEGGPPKQVTNFKDSLITGFAWSRDGKQLACLRGILLRDAVLVTDAK